MNLLGRSVNPLGVLDRERTIAPPGFNRWLVPPAALAVHLSIGQVYAFSVFKNPLLDRFGSSHTSIAIIFSIAIVMLGLSAAFGGRWMERNGPRKAMALSAIWRGVIGTCGEREAVSPAPVTAQVMKTSRLGVSGMKSSGAGVREGTGFAS